jgi:predicted deacylase
LALDARGPDGESLSIDIAWFGAPNAQRLLIVTSGIHGVEGYAGSAVQSAFMAAHVQPLPGSAVALVHALNPWGFAHLRRVNENNVDLNRNFLDASDGYAGVPEEYRMLHPLLNPPSLPAADAFHLRAGCYALRYGVQPLRRAIAAGQYEFERGLFFGGSRREQSAAIFLGWLTERCARVEHLLALDLHTGLGPFAAMTLLAQRNTRPEHLASISSALAVPVVHGGGVESAGAYFVRGSMLGMLRQALPHSRVDAATVEFGTLGGLRMLHALREENRWHHYGNGSLDHPAKRRLRAVFNPDAARWRHAVIAQGTQLLARAVAAL